MPMPKKGSDAYNEWIKTDRYKTMIKRMSKAKKGKKRPDLSERNRRNTGEKHSMYGIKGKDHYNYGKSRSEEYKQKQSIRMSGENNPMHGKTGKNHPNFGKRKENPITSLHKLIRTCAYYSEWRLMVFGRDNFSCQDCGKRGTYLHAHHKKWFSLILEENKITSLEQAESCSELWNINNGITLCKKCHKKLHKKQKEKE